LADIAYFIDSINAEMTKKHKWIIIGGSYPGAMSAWFKSKYPEHVVASWSSSGVIKAIEEYREYDYTIYEVAEG
jgi:pimeloyl-ACP methyl ester carboxylesterase